MSQDGVVCLVVEGLVERSLSLTWAEIEALPSVSFGEEDAGRTRGIAARRWEGPLVMSVLEQARPLPEATPGRAAPPAGLSGQGRDPADRGRRTWRGDWPGDGARAAASPRRRAPRGPGR